MFLVFSSPTRFHVFPPSMVLYMPSPKLTEFLGFPSPVPTQTVEGLDCWMAMEPMFKMGCSSKTASQLPPALVVFHTPPEAAPIQMWLGSATTASMVVIRPLIPAGPIFLGFQFLNWSRLNFWAAKPIVKNDNTRINENFFSADMLLIFLKIMD